MSPMNTGRQLQEQTRGRARARDSSSSPEHRQAGVCLFFMLILTVWHQPHAPYCTVRTAKQASKRAASTPHAHAGKVRFCSRPARRHTRPARSRNLRTCHLLASTPYTSTPPPAFTKRALAACLRVGLWGSSAFLTCRNDQTQPHIKKDANKISIRSSSEGSLPHVQHCG